MKPRYIFLILSLLLCLGSITLIMVKGNPENQVSLDSVSEIGEGLLNSFNKAGHVFVSADDQEEMEIGDQINEKVMKSQQVSIKNNLILEKYINDVGNKVAESVKRPAIKYKFHIVEGYYPTAGSIAGGHIYVTTGLMKTLKSEAELAGVLAHEITHVDAKHCINAIQSRIQDGKIVESGYGGLIDIGGMFLKPGFSEAQETEADAGGVYLAYRAGYHPMAIIAAFERINKDELLKADQDNSATPVGDTVDAVGGMIVRYFKTHPPTEDRINKIKKYISDKKLLNPNYRYYIGQRNFEEKISRKTKRYKEEFHTDYIVRDTEKNNLENKKRSDVSVGNSNKRNQLRRKINANHEKKPSTTTFKKVRFAASDKFLIDEYNNLLNRSIPLKGFIILMLPIKKISDNSTEYYDVKIEYVDLDGQRRTFFETWSSNPGSLKVGDQVDLSYAESNRKIKIVSKYRLYMPDYMSWLADKRD